VLLEFPARFMIGTDTSVPESWNGISSNATFVRTWLKDLPGEVAEQIAYKNGEAVLTAEFSKRRSN
jgi:hypothetical protein